MNQKQKAQFVVELSNAGCKENTIKKIVELLEKCLVKPDTAAKRPKRLKELLDLEEWEKLQGCALNLSMVASWARERHYNGQVILGLIDEFRIDMLSKRTKYADFRMAFQNYFNKGWLSIKPDSPKLRDGGTVTTINRRGGGL